MYDELVKRLKSQCYDCKLWDGEKCCLKGDCSAHTRLDAADAIEELSKSLDDMNEANIALYGALPKWIPVTERLPEEREDVLVALRRGEIAVDYYQPNRWGYSDVTHWMPLPQPPKEE